MHVLEDAPPTVLIETCPVPSSARRRRVVGVDVWFEPSGLPAEAGATLVRSLCGTHGRLERLTGPDLTELWPSAGAVGSGPLRCRVVAREEGVHLSDQAVEEILTAVARSGRWGLVRKLEEFDGVPAYPLI